jgi:hypothetical protein
MKGERFMKARTLAFVAIFLFLVLSGETRCMFHSDDDDDKPPQQQQQQRAP